VARPDERTVSVVEQHMADMADTLAEGASRAIFLVDHVAVTELTRVMQIAGCGSSPRWEVDIDS
jgi:hypothetical protein